MVEHYVRTRFARLFCSAFSKAEAQRLERKNGIFFLQSFFFWAFFLKRKSVKGILVSIDSATNYRYQDFLAAFFDGIGAKKANKETPNRLRGERHYSWRATFKKVDETIARSECEHTAKSQFIYFIYSIP